MPIGTGVPDSNARTMPEYEWQVEGSNVRQASPTVAQMPWSSSQVVNAGGPVNMPPIVSPNQAAPEAKSSMLAPIQVEAVPIVQDTLVTPTAAQWPDNSPYGNANSNYRVANGNGNRNMPVQIQSMDPISNRSMGFKASYQEPTGNDLPPIVQGQVVPDPMATQEWTASLEHVDRS